MPEKILKIEIGEGKIKSFLYQSVFSEKSKIDGLSFKNEKKVVFQKEFIYDFPSFKDFRLKILELYFSLLKNDLIFSKVEIFPKERVLFNFSVERNFFRKKPSLPLSFGEMEKYIKNCQLFSFKKAQEFFSSFSQKPFLFLAKIKKIEIDGKIISDPLGKKGKEILVKIANFYLPEKIENEVKDVFSSKRIEILPPLKKIRF